MGEDVRLLDPPPPRDHERNEMWLDEQIWGHRLWDSQSAWLLFLEVINVAEACHREDRLLDERGNFYPLTFSPLQRLHLRNILFNNEMLLRISERVPDSDGAWKEWLAWMRDNARGVRSRDFSYLRPRFASFQQFASLVAMLRASAVESDTNRRWTTRFVFPFGPNALYEDLDVRPDDSVERQYINFGRTGELVYLMLCRAANAPQLRPHMARLFAGDNRWNMVVGLLQPDVADTPHVRDKSYLPYRSHSTFDRLADDWLQVLERRLPVFDALPHLVTLSALHVSLYQLQVAAEWCGDGRAVHCICEVVAPRKSLVRELSIRSYQINAQLPQRAVESYLGRIEQSAEWVQAASQPGAFAQCQDILRERVRWPKDREDYDGPNDAASLLAGLRRAALSRHRQHVANIHRTYGRDVGLVSKRGTNRLRYAPTDGLLKALILANVGQRMEFKEFLARLFVRYGLVFGDREAERVLDRGEYDRKAFQANAERLEQRLGSLGMLRRLSDACAYVHNPFGRSPT